MNLIIGGIVFGLVAYWDYHHEGKISEAIPAAYFFLQVLAIVYLELVVFRQLKVMRMSNKSSVKTADLSPRRVIDYIPQSLLVLCAVLYLGFLAAVFFRYGINFTDKVIINILAITLMNVFFFLVLDHFSKGKKLDPHQSKNDKNRQISVLARGLVLVSCLSSGFLILTLSTHVFGVSQILATINSAFFQISLLLFMKPSLDALDLSQTDFSVYKK
ncbi:MAG: hypothetical protein HWD86_01695 [Kangiellaceae bacterium]|nr:hypothetical protein [Kangiellaceae bacterium]